MRNLNRLSIALVATFSLLLSPFNSSAQNIGINGIGATPDNSALLDLSSTDKGFLITRVDTASIAAPAFGLMTVAPIDSCLYMFSGVSWKSLGGVGNNCGSASGGTGGTGGSSSICGDPFTDTRDSETYGTVEIGNQCWMSENLAYLPSVVGPFTASSTIPYYYVNGYNGTSVTTAKNQSNYTTYGVLYNWPAIMDGTGSSSSTNPSGVQGVCPTGWHLPSDAEWKELEMELGMTQTEADGTGNSSNRGATTNVGSQLKTSSFGGTNSSGFTLLPGGVKSAGGGFFGLGATSYLWSVTESGSGADAWFRALSNSGNGVSRNTAGKSAGNSVRCVRD